MNKDLPIVCVLTSGGSGSRLLTQILDYNNIFMGIVRGKTGEDEFTWSRLLRSEAFKNEIVKSYKKEENNIESLLYNELERYTNHIFLKGKDENLIRFKFRDKVLKAEQKVVSVPKKLKGIGFKNATNSTIYPEFFGNMVKSKGLKNKIYFIHLTRHLNPWLKSGIAKGTIGVKRPIFNPYRSNFSDDFNKVLWFNSLNKDLKIGNEIFDIHNVDDDWRLKNREYIESLLWMNSQKRCLSIKQMGLNYLHIKLEEILSNPETVRDDLSNFLNIPITIPDEYLNKKKLVFDEIIPEGFDNDVVRILKMLNY
jgi:hypothetical protein